ncbi:FAD/NAD(P)-binding protein [Kutzneria viridogrisea]|uniref:NAD(P)/FAD-binding protein YdhS n=1 Tax=Kutzneria viridogrisea TaxID=47990 RepID=A0ABR6BKG1_9PSEU|nr:putative NAD(P)/FAD-binding protein YdhS [Kutzneria viridogrisea]
MSATLVIVGAGPRGTGVLERIAANLPELYGEQELAVHLVDPFPPGAGRVWRYEQSPLLRMNSMAEDVTMWLDESVTCEGPVRTGPSLAQWADSVREEGLGDPELTAELRAMTPASFPSRRLQSRYLEWVFAQVLRDLPERVSVTVHATTATSVTDAPDGRQQVWLADRREPLLADVLVLTLGHLDADPGEEQRDLRMFARVNGLRYLPPEYTADSNLSVLRAGEDVLLRGFGLAFVDAMALLTEGRGGRFHEQPDGSLRYEPSGREPRLHVGSRRGVPYHAKTTYRLRADRPQLPRFFSADAMPDGPLEFRRDVWPLMAKEIAWGYYHELFNGHRERVALDWAEFDRRYAALDWGGAPMRELVEASVPSTVDRLDFEALDKPLRGLRFDTSEQLQRHVHSYVAADVARRTDQSFSADLGAFYALLSAYGQLAALLAAGRLAARDQVHEVDGWWSGFFSFMASGPPDDRLRQLLALSDAGVVRFLGADMWVEADQHGGRFRAGSSSTPEVVTATALVEARLPRPSVRHSRDELLRTLGGVEELLTADRFSHNTGLLRIRAADGRVLDAQGKPHPNRFALGAHTNSRAVAAFARPMVNAPAFRQNDAAAREVLRELAHRAGAPRVRVA